MHFYSGFSGGLPACMGIWQWWEWKPWLETAYSSGTIWTLERNEMQLSPPFYGDVLWVPVLVLCSSICVVRCLLFALFENTLHQPGPYRLSASNTEPRDTDLEYTANHRSNFSLDFIRELYLCSSIAIRVRSHWNVKHVNLIYQIVTFDVFL